MGERKEKSAQRNIKNSVFCDLFAQKENTFQLYQVLHPEDSSATVDDIENVNIDNVLTNDIYNDLGFTVHDRLMILVEAQSTWTENILIRVLIYLAETYRRYARDNDIDLYSTTKAELPIPELYVIYTGDKTVPKQISLKRDFFSGASGIDAEVTVITESDSSDIVGQYIIFSKVVTEQIREKGPTREAVETAIKICQDKNILREYLKLHEGEVITMMMSLFDQEEVTRIYLAAQKREALQEGHQEGHQEGLQEGLQEGHQEGRIEGIQGAIEIMRGMGLQDREIAEKIRAQYGLTEEEADKLLVVKA